MPGPWAYSGVSAGSLDAIETYGIMVLRSGKKWSELGLRSEKPLDVTEAIRKVNALQMPGRPPRIHSRLNSFPSQRQYHPAAQ